MSNEHSQNYNSTLILGQKSMSGGGHAFYTRQKNMMSDHLMSCLENWCVDENYTR